MTSDYLKYVRSLERLHKVVERDITSNARKATSKFVEDIGAIADKIALDGEEMIALVEAEAKSASEKLVAESAAAVTRINKVSTKAAAKLFREAEKHGDEKSAALAAQKIIKETEQTFAEINQQAEDALAKIAKQAESAATKSRKITEKAARTLAEAGKEATRSFAFFVKKTAAKFPANGEAENGDDATMQEAQVATAEIIKKLTNDVKAAHQAAEETAEKLRKTAEEAVASVRRTADEASALIEKTREEAGDKIIAAAEQVASGMPGEGKAEFFGSKSLKEKFPRKP